MRVTSLCRLLRIYPILIGLVPIRVKSIESCKSRSLSKTIRAGVCQKLQEPVSVKNCKSQSLSKTRKTGKILIGPGLSIPA
jgi:hypothetical protein